MLCNICFFYFEPFKSIYILFLLRICFLFLRPTNLCFFAWYLLRNGSKIFYCHYGFSVTGDFGRFSEEPQFYFSDMRTSERLRKSLIVPFVW